MPLEHTLQQLKDIHLPQTISMWGKAPGWIILYLITIGLICYSIYFLYQRKKKNDPIYYALQRLDQLQSLMQTHPDKVNIAAEISILIRLTALSYFKRDHIAGLSGNDWLQFLNHSGCTEQFTTAAGQLLMDAPYRKDNNCDFSPLFALTRNWLTVIKNTKGK